MKYLFTLLLLPALLFAQDHIRIEEIDYEGFTAEKVSVYQVEVELAKKKDLMDHWYKFLKSSAEEDIDKSDNELRTK